MRPFFEAPYSIAEIASQTGIKPNTLYRWVEKWCALGLLEVVGSRPKRGRPVKLYKTTAERFFVPFAATSAPTHEALLRELDSDFHDAFYKSFTRARNIVAPDWGFSFFVDEGSYKMYTYQNDTVPFDPDNESDIISWWSTDFYLTYEEAKVLRSKLRDLWYRNKAPSGNRRYLLQLRLAPAAD